jgi:hypothetical protein
MSPFSLVVLLSLLTPPQNAPQVPAAKQFHFRSEPPVVLQTNPGVTCFTMRTYYFKRQNGNAPVLAGTSTCTPASVLRQQTGPLPRPRLVPMGLKSSN